ncbi:MAG: hypothetical protein JOZ89_06005 [Gammaproteobacteria bacterium]|nr:hypothetical protein [Gammaproteobacteria bacterium]
MRKQHIAAPAATLTLLAAFLSTPLFAADEAGSVSAVWTPKELRFVYMGFTSKFSCDGLADRMRKVLLLLGARKDLQVTPSGCSAPLGRPDPFPGVMLRINVLEPVEQAHGANAASGMNAANGGTAGAAPVPAHWKMIDVNAALARDPLWQAGQCELLEQIKQSVLPKFSARNVSYQSTCVPNQLNLGATQLRAEVLVPDNPDAGTSAAKPGGAH